MKKRRGNTRFFAYFASAALGMFIIYQLLLLAVNNLDIFLIQEVNFSGNSAIFPDKLQETAEPLIGKNLYKVTQEEVESLFGSYTRIKRLELKRKLFNRLYIEIDERTPVFQINTQDGKIYLVDIDSVVLLGEESIFWENLPIVSVETTSGEVFPGEAVKDDFLEEMLSIYPVVLDQEPNFFDLISQIFPDKNQVVMTDYDQGYWIRLDHDNLVNNICDYMEIKNTCSFDCQTQIDMTFDNNYRVTKREK